jgi:hypothetical protein
VLPSSDVTVWVGPSVPSSFVHFTESPSWIEREAGLKAKFFMESVFVVAARAGTIAAADTATAARTA